MKDVDDRLRLSLQRWKKWCSVAFPAPVPAGLQCQSQRRQSGHCVVCFRAQSLGRTLVHWVRKGSGVQPIAASIEGLLLKMQELA